MDRDFEPGDEPVKLCLRAGAIVDFHKKVQGSFDLMGESVGFFRFDERASRRLAAIVEDHVASSRAHLPHEEAVRDLLLERSQSFEVCDVTGAPWIEIDFPADVARAAREVLPQLET